MRYYPLSIIVTLRIVKSAKGNRAIEDFYFHQYIGYFFIVSKLVDDTVTQLGVKITISFFTVHDEPYLYTLFPLYRLMSKFHSFGHITNNVLNIKRFFTHNSKNIPVYLSASFQKKNTKVSTPVTLEHPDSGEDAFLCVKKPNYSLAAVFDGVGGWASKGIDPSKFSWGLCKQLEQLVSSKQSLMKNPTELLTSAFNALKKSKTVVAGSSTACIATYEEETCKLRTLNLGDSGYMLIRNGLVEYISPPQTVQFNTPFQLSIYPTAQPYEDPMQPRVGQKNTHNILQNDVVIVATDGLFDNMEAEDCANIVRQLISSPSQDPQSLADKIVKTICQQAVSNSRDEVWLSPFARAAQTVGYRYTGGKVDDTTVLCMLFQ